MYIRTVNVFALWQLLKDKTRVCYAIEDFTYGMREFAIYINNGYVLQLDSQYTRDRSRRTENPTGLKVGWK